MNGSLKPGTLLAGRYRILARIGEGGFGTVYKALDRRKYGKRIAIKEINMATLSAQEKIEVTDSFNREITLLSRLRYKNLPRIHDLFTDPEHWYIVMDYIEGQTLEDMLARSPGGRLSVSQAVSIGVALCDVLSYLHGQDPSIIYRDVKPGNIMLTFWGQLYLIDFGIARRYRAGQQRDTGPLGSPGYAAPEQYGRAQTTTQTDVYGLGATLQTLLTGKEPLEIRQQGMLPDVYIPWKLQAPINRMMESDPSRRPRIAEVKRSLMPYVPLVESTQWPAFVFIYLVPLFIYQSGFNNSPLLGPYLLLVLAFIVSFCALALVRVWRTTRSRLSLKATLIIVGKQSRLSVPPVFSLTGWVCLLYATLAHPPAIQPDLPFLWFLGAVFIIGQLLYCIAWLKRRRELRQPRKHATPEPQVLPMQQQRQSHP